jgi:hypothetical protein
MPSACHQSPPVATGCHWLLLVASGGCSALETQSAVVSAHRTARAAFPTEFALLLAAAITTAAPVTITTAFRMAEFLRLLHPRLLGQVQIPGSSTRT